MYLIFWLYLPYINTNCFNLVSQCQETKIDTQTAESSYNMNILDQCKVQNSSVVAVSQRNVWNDFSDVYYYSVTLIIPFYLPEVMATRYNNKYLLQTTIESK